MNLKNIAIASLLGVAAVGAALYLGNLGHWFAEAQTEPEVIDVEKDPYLQLVDSPPKVVADELVYDFGAMERGDAGEHVFSLRNDGEGLMRMVKGKATCTCTKFMLGDDNDLKRLELKPGESIKVTVAWKIKETTTEEQFKTSATVYTNDPENKTLTLGVTGKIVKSIFVYPSPTLMAPDIVSKEPVNISAIIGSRLLDDLELVSAETDSEFLEVTSKKLTFENGLAEGVEGKCGYQFNVTVKPEIPIGHFQAPVRIKLRGPNGQEFDNTINVTTTRTGPIKVVAPNFDAHSMTLNLKDFDIKQGKTADLTMFVTVDDPSQELHFNVAESTNENVHLTVERDKSFTGDHLQRYVVKVDIPPDSMQEPENNGRAEFVVETDHPDVKSIRFRTKYHSY